MIAIQEYAAIGDGRTVALVGRHGSIDWLCWPRFDSPSIFGALLDEHGGGWRLAPTAASRVTRRYLDATNVLETRFDTATGTLVLTDLMPVASEEDKGRLLLPDHEILRVAECVRGRSRSRCSVRRVRTTDGAQGEFGTPAGWAFAWRWAPTCSCCRVTFRSTSPQTARSGAPRVFVRETPSTRP